MAVTTDITDKYRILVGIDPTDNSQDSLLAIFLTKAESKVLSVRFPFGATDEQKATALTQYASNVEDIYTYLYNKQGAEGEISHSENGIDRGYESAGIPSSFINDIVPMAKTI